MEWKDSGLILSNIYFFIEECLYVNLQLMIVFVQVENYEKYILECERKEKMEQEMQGEDVKLDPEQAEKWKERRECLEMLKRELSKIRDGGDDSQDWDYLLEEDDEKKEGASITEIQDEISKDGDNENVKADTSVMKQVVNSENKKDM